MNFSRTKKTINNTIWGLIYRIATLIGPFIIRTLIVNQLGIEYSGLNSLFKSILTVLNLTNLGFSSSIVFTMYKSVVEENIEEQCAMVNFYKKAYLLVGTIILVLGILVMPFLPNFVNGNYPIGINIYLLFGIYLSQTVLDYFLFAYNNAIFTAYHRNDIIFKISTVRYIIQYAIQSVILIYFKNYYMYVIILPLMVVFNNLSSYIVAKRVYPNIKCEGKLDSSIKKDIFKRVGTLFGHKLGNTVLVGVDSIIISSFLGLKIMGIYGNYYYILTAVNALVEIFTNAIRSGIGHKLITDSNEDNYKLFNVLTYFWMFLIGISASFMLCLYQPFIGGIWYNAKYLLNIEIVILIVLYFYTWMFRIMQLTYRDAAGLWTKDWAKPYIAMALNIIFSIYLVYVTKSIIGVLIPSICIFIFIYFPWEASILFKYLFKKSLNEYIIKILKYILISLFAMAASYLLCIYSFNANTAKTFIFRIPVVFIVNSTIWFIFTRKTLEYTIIKNKIFEIFVKKYKNR